MELCVKIEVANEAEIHHVMTQLAVKSKKYGFKIKAAKLGKEPEKKFDKTDPTNFMRDKSGKANAVKKRLAVMKKKLAEMPIEEIKDLGVRRGIAPMKMEKFTDRTDAINFVIQEVTKKA